MAMERSDARSPGRTGRSSTCSFSSGVAAISAQLMSGSRVLGERRDDVAERAHPGHVGLSERGEAYLGVVTGRHQEDHLVERGQPVPVGHVQVEVQVSGLDAGFEYAREALASHGLELDVGGHGCLLGYVAVRRRSY